MRSIFFKFFFIYSLFFSKVIYANNWNISGGSYQNHQYSELTQINQSNLVNLKKIWEIQSKEKKYFEVQTNPIYFEGYLINVHNNNLVFINVDNGNIENKILLDNPIAKHSLAIKDSMLYVPTGKGIAVINFKTKQVNKIIGNLPYYSAPIITSNAIISVSLNGVIESRDLTNHELNWNLSLYKHNVSPRVWSGISYDEITNQIYIVTSNPNDLIGEGVEEEGGYSCSLIAINASSGEINWQFQDTIHDVWDLDMTGPPLPTFYNDKPAVIGLSKTGNIIYVNAISGKAIFPFSKKEVKPSKLNKVKLSKYQKIFTKPKPLIALPYNPNTELEHMGAADRDYVMHILRNSNFGKPYEPLSLEKDVAMFGLHGGAEWPGGALHPKKNILVVSSNRNPWILRAFYEDSFPNKRKIIYKSNNIYNNKCLICHGSSLKGYHYNESKGNLYFPPLIGVTKKYDKNNLISIKNFNNNHRYTYDTHQKTILERYKLLKSIRSRNDYKFDIYSFSEQIKFTLDKNYETKLFKTISQKDLNELYKFFQKVDNTIENNNELKISGIWQLLLDRKNRPASSPPWGFLNAIDMNTGEYLWKIPNGEMKFEKKYLGSISTGGTLITKSNIVITTGTQDSNFRILNLKNGKELYKDQLMASGSSPPMTFMHKGCQYIVFNATGSKWFGLGNKKSNQIAAYKLKDCNYQ